MNSRGSYWPIFIIALGGFILFLPALYNRFPLVFPDTGTYLIHAIELRGQTDRPPYYSIFLLPLHLQRTLWPIPIVQCLIASSVCYWLLRKLVPQSGGAGFALLIAAAALLTSVAWHAIQIMPDVFTPLLILLMFLFCLRPSLGFDLSTLAFIAVLVTFTIFHNGHLLLMAILLVAGGALRWWLNSPKAQLLRYGVIGVLVLAMSAASFAVYSFAVTGRASLSTDAPLFMLGRMIGDGTAAKYLRKYCPGIDNPFCDVADRLDTDTNIFLWNGASSLAEVRSAHGEAVTRDAAARVVTGVLRNLTAEQAAASLHNSWAMLLNFRTLDADCDHRVSGRCGQDTRVYQAIQRYFPGSLEAFMNGRQMKAELPIEQLRSLHTTVVALGSVAWVVCLAVAWRRNDWLLTGFLLFVATGILANAVLFGVLSGPFDRYQSRVIWLLPFSSGIAVWRLLRPPELVRPAAIQF
jgi:hypothetical protein